MSVQLELDLFGAQGAALPEGMRLQANFLSADEEQQLLRHIEPLPFARIPYKGYEALRRGVSYGASYDFSAGALNEAAPLPGWLEPLRGRVAHWLGRAPQEFTQALVSEYAPGTPLGWHRDVPDFEDIVGVSLLGEAIMRFRPWPHVAGRRGTDLRLPLAPRSAYLLSGPARWAWQHSVLPTPALRYSITLRTPRRARADERTAQA